MKIPIRNILYLLTYAWNVLPIKELAWVTKLNADSEIQLFAKVLAHGTKQLLKTGLDREYTEISDDVCGVKGKIDFADTIKRNLLASGRTSCVLDSLSIDVLQNQVLKATIKTLLGFPTKHFGGELKSQLTLLLGEFSEVRDIALSSRLFHAIQIHRNNRQYCLLLHVCRLIFESTLVDERKGRLRFVTFEEGNRLNKVFEKFLLNFYRREATSFRVKAEQFKWRTIAGSQTSIDALPRMSTDMVLRNSERTMVVDAKFYVEMLKGQYSKKLNSNHIYQMLSYLQNLPEKNSPRRPEGMLLYPTVDHDRLYQCELNDYKLTAATVDLSQEWEVIHERLLSLLLPFSIESNEQSDGE
jgi:5-methylcytosine-specific restriction enzyme subunit McrC